MNLSDPPKFINPFTSGWQRMMHKAVLGDGFNMDEARDKTLQSLNNQMGSQLIENPSLQLPGFGAPIDPMADILPKGTGPQVTDLGDTAAKSVNDMTFNTDDMKMSDAEQNVLNQGKAPKPSPLGMLPAVGNLYSLGNALINGPEETDLGRVSFDRVDYNPIIDANNAAISRGINTTNRNIKNNARTFGQLNAGMSAANLRGAQAIGENTAKLGALQRNQNAEIANRESTINTQLSNQETILNEQNKAAHQAGIVNDLIGLGTTFAGFGADKAMMAADFTRNNNFLNSMEYMSPIFRAMFSGKDLNLGTIFQE